MFGKSREHKNALLLKHLLIHYKECPEINLLPKNEKEWGIFMDMAYRNRLITLLYHFLICKNCAKTVSSSVKNIIQSYYLETVIRYKNYQKIKNKLRLFIRQTKTPLILIKDLDNNLIRQYYPPYYVPQKGDIDLWSKQEDFEKFRRFIGKIGYDPKGKRFDWPDYQLPVYKFYPEKNYPAYPQIDFRYHSLIIPNFKINLLDKHEVNQIADTIWKNLDPKKSNFSELTDEYLFIHLYLIYFFEDYLKGINNLYRIWIFYNLEKNNGGWIKLANKLKITNIIDFAIILAKREFEEFPYKKNYPAHIKLLLSLVNIGYISRAKKIREKFDFQYRSDRHVRFSSRNLLSNKSSFDKIVFYFHHKRLFFLIWALLFS